MTVQILIGDCREKLRSMPDQSVHTCVTSPPYFGLRDYGHAGQMGLEPTPDEFVAAMVAVFREVRRVLREDGTLWLNLGDSYARGFGGGSPGAKSATNVGAYEGRKSGKVPNGLSQKDLIGIPWKVAFALQSDGWILRQDIIWHKPNPMPESVRDRCTKAHEYIFMFSKSPRYYFDADAIKEPAKYGAKGSEFHTGKTGDHQLGRASAKPRESKKRGEFNGKTNELPGREAFRAITDMRNKRSVWLVSTKPFKGAHFATFPPDLIEPCILAGCPDEGLVLDPFFGAGTTGLVAKAHGRDCIGIELNPEYAAMARERVDAPPKASRPKRPANDNLPVAEAQAGDLFGAASGQAGAA